MASQSVRTTMTADPRRVEPGHPVTEAARLMREEDVGSLPVVENERLVGVITDRDIVMRLVAEGRDAGNTSVGEILSADLVTVSPDQPLVEALELMARHQVRRLPVVEDEGRLVGVISQADVARDARGEETGGLVEEISRPDEPDMPA
jgi:CBS domain-containing protein